jgi:hypothetical protein
MACGRVAAVCHRCTDANCATIGKEAVIFRTQRSIVGTTYGRASLIRATLTNSLQRYPSTASPDPEESYAV